MKNADLSLNWRLFGVSSIGWGHGLSRRLLRFPSKSLNYFLYSDLFDRPFRLFNQLPKLRILLKRLVLLHLDAGPEQKVLQRVPAKNSMHHQPKLVPLKINSVITNSKSLQNPPRPLQFAELVDLGVHDLLRQSAKFTKDLQLQFLRHPCQFGGAGRVKNDLERTH